MREVNCWPRSACLVCHRGSTVGLAGSVQTGNSPRWHLMAASLVLGPVEDIALHPAHPASERVAVAAHGQGGPVGALVDRTGPATSTRRHLGGQCRLGR